MNIGAVILSELRRLQRSPERFRGEARLSIRSGNSRLTPGILRLLP
jgi:hypothetical protein